MMSNAFSEYAVLHAAISSGELPPRFLLFNAGDGSGGYADRLKGAIMSLLLAMLLDRALVINWMTPGVLSHILPPRNIDWSIENKKCLRPLLAGEIPFVNLIDPAKLNPMLPVLQSADIEDVCFQRKPLVALSGNMLFYKELLRNPYLAEKVDRYGFSDEEFLPAHFKRLFALSFGEPRKILTDKRHPLVRHALPVASLFADARAQGRRVIGIQIRTGGDGEWRDPTFLHKSVADEFFAAVSAFERNNNEDALWFLETDSQSLKDEALLAHKGKVVSTDWPICHIDRSPNRQSVDMERVIVKHLLLANCDELFIGPGGYGLTAAWIGCVPYKKHPDFMDSSGLSPANQSRACQG